MNAKDITDVPQESNSEKEYDRLKAMKDKIVGYGKPSEEQVALVNKFKAHEKALGQLFIEAEKSGLVDGRTLAVGKTQAQTAYMWLNRAVFQPEDFYKPTNGENA